MPRAAPEISATLPSSRFIAPPPRKDLGEMFKHVEL
jgi:hypothetical protein